MGESMRTNRSLALALAGLLVAAGLAACGGGSSSTTKSKSSGVLNIGMPNGPQTENHNPFLGSSAGASLGYRFVIYEPLVMVNPAQPAQAGKPWLATKWEWSDNFQKVVFTIRDKVKNPVGTGPYVLKSFTPQTITLKLRDSYWQPLPKVGELRYTSYNDNNAQTTALATGAAEWSFVFIPNYKAVFTSKDPAHYK